MTTTLFPFAGYWWLYLVFTALILMLLALDLGVFHRKAHAPSFRKATFWMAVWVALALLFCFGLYQYTGATFGAGRAKQTALEFLTGYVVEESLSLDNMFVFVMVFKSCSDSRAISSCCSVLRNPWRPGISQNISSL